MLTNEANGFATNGGSLKGGVSNAGTFTNNNIVSGGLTNTGNGVATNAGGSIDSVAVDGGSFNNNGTVTKNVAVAASGTFDNQGSGIVNGGVTNAGYATNEGSIFNGGAVGVTVNEGGNFTNTGNIDTVVVNESPTPGVTAGGIFSNSGPNANISGAVTNYSTGSTLINGSTPGFDNTGSVGGVLDNFGVARNEGSLGGLKNEQGATFIAGGGTINGVANSGAINVNFTGALYVTGAGIANIGPGKVTNNGYANAMVASNAGTQANPATITNNKTWDGDVASNGPNGTIANKGTWTGSIVNDGGAFNDSGTLNGALTNGSTTAKTSGTVQAGGSTAAPAVITGAILNSYSSAFTVTGALTANSTFDNVDAATLGFAANPTGLTFSGITTLTNKSAGNGGNAGVTVASGDSLSAASIVNGDGNVAATISNAGALVAGTIANKAHATLTTTGTLTTALGLTNDGTVNATGTLNGSVLNEGTGSFNVTGAGGLDRQRRLRQRGVGDALGQQREHNERRELHGRHHPDQQVDGRRRHRRDQGFAKRDDDRQRRRHCGGEDHERRRAQRGHNHQQGRRDADHHRHADDDRWPDQRRHGQRDRDPQRLGAQHRHGQLQGFRRRPDRRHVADEPLDERGWRQRRRGDQLAHCRIDRQRRRNRRGEDIERGLAQRGGDQQRRQRDDNHHRHADDDRWPDQRRHGQRGRNARGRCQQ